MSIDENTIYRVTIGTDRGDIVMDLDPRIAPASVNNFVTLARQGYYDGLTFHRVEPGFVIQGGCPEGTRSGRPRLQVRATSRCRASTSRARWPWPTPVPTPTARSSSSASSDLKGALPKQYNLFGQVTEGMDAVHAVQKGDVLNTVTIEELPAA